MYGAGSGILAGIFKSIGVDYVEIRAEQDPRFPGINPEPIEPHVRALEEAVVEHKCDAGLVTDGDADSIGAVDEHGNFVDPHKIFAVLLEWLLSRKKWPGDVTRAFNTTCMIDRICARYGRTLHEHGIGFKYRRRPDARKGHFDRRRGIGRDRNSSAICPSATASSTRCCWPT